MDSGEDEAAVLDRAHQPDLGGAQIMHDRLFLPLVDFSPDAVFLHGLDGRFVYVNDAACSMLGYSRDELLPLSPWDFVVNDSREDILVLWREMAPATPVMVEGLFRRKDGTTL